MPRPRVAKISTISAGPRASANPTAVPTNGAEQDVAIKVAKAPAAKASSIGLRGRTPAAAAAKPGMPIGSTPHKLAANKVVTVAMPARNHGCWNWMPQPTAAPASLRPISTTAMARKLPTTPEAVASRPNRTRRRSAPA